MSEAKFEQLELDFEGDNGMEKEKVIDAEFKEVKEESAGEEVSVQAQFTVSLLSDGRLDVTVPEGMPELKPVDVEALSRQVYEQLHDTRIAQSTLELFKQRLSF